MKDWSTSLPGSTTAIYSLSPGASSALPSSVEFDFGEVSVPPHSISGTSPEWLLSKIQALRQGNAIFNLTESNGLPTLQSYA